MIVVATAAVVELLLLLGAPDAILLPLFLAVDVNQDSAANCLKGGHHGWEREKRLWLVLFVVVFVEQRMSNN